jgi:hypothetical protein
MGSDSRAIVGYMGAAVVFALIGDLIKSKTTSVPSGSYVKIIVGGTIGAGLLALLADTGNTAGEYAKGLALITMVASILINGTDVFSGVSHVTGTLKTTTPAPTIYSPIKVPKVG